MDPFLDEERTSEKSFDPLSLLRMFWRRKWLFFVPFVLCLAMAYVAIRTMTPVYEATGVIRIIYEGNTSRLIEDGTRRYRRASDMDREAMATIWTIVTGPNFLNSVVRDTRLYTGHPSLPQGGAAALPEPLTPEEMETVDRLSRRLKRQIRVKQNGQHIFDISVRDIDPRRTLILSRVVLDNLLEEERATRLAPRTTTRDFLTRQRTNYEESLEAAEDTLATFQRTLLTESLAGNPINAANLAQAESSLLHLQDQYYNRDVNEMDRLEQQARSIVGELPDVRSIMREADFAEFLSELGDLEFANLLGARDAEIENDLGRSRLILSNMAEDRVGQQYPQLGLMDRNRLGQYIFFMIYREGKNVAMGELAEYIQSYKDFTTRQPVLSARLEELQDEVNDSREMLANIEREIQQQTMSLEASDSEIGYRVVVRQDPTEPKFPVEPDVLRLSFMGFALSMAIGFGLVILSIVMDRSFTTVEQMEKALGLTVIGTLPVIQDEHFKRKRRLRLIRWLTLVVLILGVSAVFLLYVYPRIS